MGARSEDGAALLSVILLVAVMATVTVAVVDEIRFVAMRTANVEERAQARWYAVGAEELAKTVVTRSYLVSRGVTTANEPWGRGVTRFPLDDGYIDGVVNDGSNCFNLNAVVEADGRGGYTGRATGAEQLLRLVEGVDVTGVDAQAIVSGVIDWIDADAQPYGGAGAEDFDYARDEVAPRRTPNTLFTDATELRAVMGVSREVYEAVRPYVCVRPVAEFTTLNVNTLTPAHAPLLAAVFGPLLSIDEARAVIAARGDITYDTVEEFLDQDELEAIAPTDEIKSQLAVRARYFTYEAHAVLRDATAAQSGLIEIDENGVVRVLIRRHGYLQ